MDSRKLARNHPEIVSILRKSEYNIALHTEHCQTSKMDLFEKNKKLTAESR